MSDRRQFLKQSALIAAGLMLSNKAFKAVAKTVERVAAQDGAQDDILRGFIVSDAHCGWDNSVQPTLEMQKKMIGIIRHRFPKLDVCLDTGDAHHNNYIANDVDRGNWSDAIMYQDEPIPFYYIPGNHEITVASEQDVEFACNVLGSHEARPYYSVDIKGVHFVSVPELIRTVYVSRELMDWLRLDLELNKDKTTILLSHNSLIGLSKNYEEGYRGVVNTQEIVDLMNQYPNCIAWMYGHNHNYEVVPKYNKLFVSNGRIGGFDPSKGKHGLGGIYFEITKDKVDIRCYSAEFDKFVDEFDSTELFHGTLDVRTSLDAKAAAAYSMGVGRARNSEKSPLFHHHISTGGQCDIYLAGVDGLAINEDPEFKYYMRRHTGSSDNRELMGTSVSNDKVSYEWKNPGLLLLPFDNKKGTRMSFPFAAFNKYVYYRAAAGHDYNVVMDMEGSEGGGQRFSVVATLYDRLGARVRSVTSKTYTLSGERQRTVYPVNFPPELKHNSIYVDENSDNVFNLSVEIDFEPLQSSVMVRRVAIEMADGGNATVDPSIVIGKERFSAKGSFSQNQFQKGVMASRVGNRSVVTVGAGGNGMVTWLMRVNGVRWQVLGAQCEDKASSMAIGPMRNLYSHRKEVVLNPLFGYEDKTFVYKMRGVNRAEIFPMDKGNANVEVKVLETLSADKAEIEVWSRRDDLKVEGAGTWVRNGNKYIISVKQGDTVAIK